MTIKVLLARAAEEREAIYRFRYRVYVEELGLKPPEADHAHKRLADPLDDCSLAYGLVDDRDSVLGALRCTMMADVPDPAKLIAKFAMEPAIAAFGLPALGTTSRFMLDPKLRLSLSIMLLIKAAYEDAQARAIRLNYGDCSPHMLPFYESMGYRRYVAAYNDSGYGFKVPILMLVGDKEHFAAVRSPLGRLAEPYPHDAGARAWFAATYPGWVAPASAALMPVGQFFDLLAERVASDPLHAVALFRGLARDQVENFLKAATLVGAAAGDRIVREGERDDTVYILLKGLADVVRGDGHGRPVATLGAGDIFGEIGFLTATPRTATIMARTPCEVLVLSGRFIEKFIATEPAHAARILFNLARILAGRLAQTTLRVAGAGADADG